MNFDCLTNLVLLKPRIRTPSIKPQPAVSLYSQSVPVNVCLVAKRVQIYNAFYFPTKTFLIKFLVSFKSFKVKDSSFIFTHELRFVSKAGANIKRVLLSNQIKTQKNLFIFF